jgi:hypothetical protein
VTVFQVHPNQKTIHPSIHLHSSFSPFFFFLPSHWIMIL